MRALTTPWSRAGWPLRGLVTLTAMLVTALAGESADHPPVIHVEQPTGIELTQYAETWPALEPYIAQIRQGDREAVVATLRSLAAGTDPSDGVLNLLAQMEREDGSLDKASLSIERAIALHPEQPLHHFQQALICFAHLSRATGGLDRWNWHNKTKDAYQRAFDLDPRPVPYRYYLAYTYLQAPGIAGGDKDKALQLVQEAIDMGEKEFYVVRADVHRLRSEPALAFADYDRAKAENVFKLNAFLAAGRLALERKDPKRAKDYFDWAVYCRPESPRTHEGLGDYFTAVGDTESATKAYEAALRADQEYEPAREKLATLTKAR
jgi:tetratricopeptide (TPR) repeat protein